MHTDRLSSVELLRRCKVIDPTNPEWPWNLSIMYSLETRHQPTPARKDWSGHLALAELELARELSRDEFERVILLNEVMKAAFDLGDFSKGERYASELVSLASARETAYARGSATYNGNMILGAHRPPGR